jgi:biopolymer transport protein ExbD
MPRRRSRDDDDRLDPNLTPLLDVVLQLITFFMMLVHFGSRIEGAEASIRLPIAPAALPAGDLALERLVVTINADGDLIVGGLARSDAAAVAWWNEQAASRRKERELPSAPGQELSTQVVIRGDRDAPYGAIRQTLKTAQDAGFAHFSLVVEREERR